MSTQSNKIDIQNFLEISIDKITNIIESDNFKKEFTEHQEKTVNNKIDYSTLYQIEPEKLKEPFTI